MKRKTHINWMRNYGRFLFFYIRLFTGFVVCLWRKNILPHSIRDDNVVGGRIYDTKLDYLMSFDVSISIFSLLFYFQRLKQRSLDRPSDI